VASALRRLWVSPHLTSQRHSATRGGLAAGSLLAWRGALAACRHWSGMVAQGRARE